MESRFPQVANMLTQLDTWYNVAYYMQDIKVQWRLPECYMGPKGHEG